MSVATAAKRAVPKPIKRALAHPYWWARSRVRMFTLKRSYRRRYGPDFVYTVNAADEMYLFTRDNWKWPHHVEKMRAESDALHGYLASGEIMVGALEMALHDQGQELSQVESFLEFASGYGRFTRFLVCRLDASKVTVSDISHPAVDFERQTFGVAGFYSTEFAEELEHPGQYDVIFVASLFSHLAIEHWTPWLRRLYDLTAPGGLLVFSTHGPYVREVIYGKHWQDRFEEKAEGFSYLLANETGDRLPVEYYGSAFVTQEFVEMQVAEHGLGTIKRAYPAGLAGSQDLYVIAKPAR